MNFLKQEQDITTYITDNPRREDFKEILLSIKIA